MVDFVCTNPLLALTFLFPRKLHTVNMLQLTVAEQSTPNDLQFTDIPLVSQADCQAVWGDVIEITDRIQCAGGNGVSSCMVCFIAVICKLMF